MRIKAVRGTVIAGVALLVGACAADGRYNVFGYEINGPQFEQSEPKDKSAGDPAYTVEQLPASVRTKAEERVDETGPDD